MERLNLDSPHLRAVKAVASGEEVIIRGWVLNQIITLLIQIYQKRAIRCYFLFFFFCYLDDTSKVPHSCEPPQIFSDGVTWFLIGLVILLFCIIVFLARSKVKKWFSKRKTPTPPQTAGKGEFPQKSFCISIKFS